MLRRALAICSILLFATTSTHAADRKCSLLSPVMSEQGGKTSFKIDLSCAAGAPGAKPFVVGRNLIVGLTVYALDIKAKEGDDAARNAAIAKLLAKTGSGSFDLDDVHYTVVQKPLPAASPARLIVADDPNREIIQLAPPYDFAVQQTTVKDTTGTVSFEFTADSQTISDHNHYLFAVWPASKKKNCNAKDDDARSGCKAFGYLIGDDGGVTPVDFYPGKAELESDASSTGSRWIVERFR